MITTHKSQNSTHFLWLAFFYSIAHGGILFIPNAIYWDDWTLHQVDSAIIVDTFKQVGIMLNWVGHLHIYLLHIGSWLYKILTFILMFGSGLALNAIIKRHLIISDDTRFFIVLLFLILPFNWARVALIDFPYTLCYFLFFLAWVLIDRYRLVALILFFFSFSTNSLLVFYALPFLDMYLRSEKQNNIREFTNFCKRKIDFIILPFAFFLIKIFFYPPSGLYEGYNQQYSLGNLVFAPIMQVYDLMKLNINLFLLITLTITSYHILIKNRLIKNPNQETFKPIALIGILAIIFGVFPYWILGHAPTFEEWTSRHQLLLPLGFALFLAAIVLSQREGRLILLSLIMGGSFALNINTYKDFYVDSNKQYSLIELIKNEHLIESSSIIVFNDQTISLNAINRTYRFYEWNGLLASAYKNEKRFGININDYQKLLNGEYKKDWFTGSYQAGDFPTSTEKHTVVKVNIQELPAPSYKARLISQLHPNLKLEVEALPLLDLKFK